MHWAEPPPTPGTRPNLDLLERLTYVEAVLWFGAELADGLAHAHARGIIHRDIKPANVLFSDEGRPMLLDFNLAAEGAKGDLPVGGTLRYMAPEVLAAAADHQGWADARSDVYSLGLVLFELLTGTFPFPDQTGLAHDVVARMRADRVGPAPDAARHRPDVSPAVAAILKTCLAADPAQRYATAAHLREDRNLLVVGAYVLRTSHPAKIRQPGCLARTIEQHLRLDCEFAAVRRPHLRAFH